MRYPSLSLHRIFPPDVVKNTRNTYVFLRVFASSDEKINYWRNISRGDYEKENQIVRET